MANTLQPVTGQPETGPPAEGGPAQPPMLSRRGPDLLQHVPALTLAIFLAPIAAGLIGTWLPAFGHFPALGHEGWSLEP